MPDSPDRPPDSLTQADLLSSHEENRNWPALIRLWLCLAARNSDSIHRAIRLIETLQFEGCEQLLDYLHEFSQNPEDTSLTPSPVLPDLLDTEALLTLDFCTLYPHAVAGLYLREFELSQQETQARTSIKWGFAARDIATKLGDRSLFAAISIPLSAAVGFLGHTEKSLEIAREAVQICRDQLAHGFELHGILLARALSNLNNRFGNGESTQEALEAAREALDLHLALDEISPGDYTEELATSFSNWGSRLFSHGRHQDALVGLMEAGSRFRTLAESNPSSHSARFAGVLRNISTVLDHLGRTDEALPFIEESVAIREELSCAPAAYHSRELASSLLTRSSILGSKGLFDKAADSARRGMELMTAADGRASRDFLLKTVDHLIGHSEKLRRLGFAGEALRKAREAVGILQDSTRDEVPADHAQFAEALGALSHGLFISGRFEDAVATSRDAVKRARNACGLNAQRHGPLLALSLGTLASHLAHTDPVQAISVNEEAISLLRPLFESEPHAHRRNLAGFLCNQASFLNRSNRPEEASTVARQIFGLMAGSQPSGNLPIIAHALLEHASALDDMGQCDDALEAVELAIQSYHKLDSDQPKAYLPDFSASWSTKAAILKSAGRPDEAIQCLDRSLALWSQLAGSEPAKYSRERATTHGLYGRILLEHSDTSASVEQALEHLRESVRLAEVTRDGYQSKDQRRIIQSKNLRPHTALLMACIEVHRRTGNPSLLAEALETIEKARARGLLEETENLPIPEEWDTPLIREFRGIRDELVVLGTSGDAYLRSTPPHPDSVTRLGPRDPERSRQMENRRNQRIAQLVHRLHEVRKEIRLLYPDWIPTAATQPASFTELTAALPTDRRTVFITFAMLPDETVALMFTDSGFVDALHFSSLTPRFHQALYAQWMSNYHGGVPEGSSARWNRENWMSFLPRLISTVSQEMVVPLWERLTTLPEFASGPVERIVFMPHGPLRLYPLHACDIGNGSILGDLVEVSYAPSGSMLKALNRPVGSTTNEIFLLGDPQGNLPFSQWETQSLAQRYRGKALVGDHATLQALVEHANNARIFAFSGHSKFSPENPEISGLLLSNEERLTAGYLLQSRLLPNCELAFINGCESALLLPSWIDEEISLPAAFLQSGARCVISTLWPVEDLAAALLSVKFHELWDGGRGLTAISALHQSQRWLRGIGEDAPVSLQVLRDRIVPKILSSSKHPRMKDAWERTLKRLETESPASPPFAHPLYWAAFTIHGIPWKSFTDHLEVSGSKDLQLP